MYRVLKDEGYSKLVSVENTDTHTIINIGALSMKVLEILNRYGHTEVATGSSLRWQIEVNKECANELAKLSMQMKAPIRDQRKVKDNSKVDAMDVLLGLASYSRRRKEVKKDE